MKAFVLCRREREGNLQTEVFFLIFLMKFFEFYKAENLKNYIITRTVSINSTNAIGCIYLEIINISIIIFVGIIITNMNSQI